jgi:hypothetical protein
MTCLSDTDCKAIRSALQGAALEAWDTARPHLLELTRSELHALAAGLTAGNDLEQTVLTAWRMEAAAQHREGNPELWEAWMARRRTTSEGISGSARRRAEARRLLIAALATIGEAVLGAIGVAIRRRLR